MRPVRGRNRPRRLLTAGALLLELAGWPARGGGGAAATGTAPGEPCVTFIVEGMMKSRSGAT